MEVHKATFVKFENSTFESFDSVKNFKVTIVEYGETET